MQMNSTENRTKEHMLARNEAARAATPPTAAAGGSAKLATCGQAGVLISCLDCSQPVLHRLCSTPAFTHIHTPQQQGGGARVLSVGGLAKRCERMLDAIQALNIQGTTQPLKACHRRTARHSTQHSARHSTQHSAAIRQSKPLLLTQPGYITSGL